MAEPTPTLDTQVALLSQFNSEVVKPRLEELSETQKKIQTSLERLDVVHRTEFTEYKLEVEQKFKDGRKRTWIQNVFSAGGATIITGLVAVIVTNWFKGGH